MEYYMRIITDIPNYVLSDIRDLISKGKYPSLSDFLLTAAENQLTLEKTSVDDVIEISSEGVSIHSVNNINYAEMPFPLADIPTMDFPTVKQGMEVWEDWIWGQINRFLPIKFAARYLAVSIAESKDFPTIESFSVDASERARAFGLYLKNQDEIIGKNRDERLSTGFPIGKKIEGSLDRYRSQFIGFQKQDESITGALFDLSFANLKISDQGLSKIGLTNQGKRFAKLTNSVIDSNNYEVSLSETEKDFVIKHILSYVPGEVSLFTIMLQLLDKGIDRREDLNRELSGILNKSGWSDGLISTYRSGAISRMYELGLISKDRKGLEVSYKLTISGLNFLQVASESRII